jgi:hypothetical protein
MDTHGFEEYDTSIFRVKRYHWNEGSYLLNYIVSYPRRQHSSWSPLYEHEILHHNNFKILEWQIILYHTFHSALRKQQNLMPLETQSLFYEILNWQYWQGKK